MDARLLGKELIGKTGDGREKRYRVEFYLGGGRFGEVYKAAYKDRLVALKITKRTFNDATDLAEMLQEALLLSELKARAPSAVNLVSVYEYGVLENYFNRGFIAMEYVAGGSLRDRLDALGMYQPLSIPEVVNILRQTCNALRLAHSLEPPVLHRDVKPSNILIARDGTVKLSDWGLAAHARRFSYTLPMAGDLCYKSPEALEAGIESVSSDIYGLGIVAYEMATGHYPFPLSGLKDLSGQQAVNAHAFLRRGAIIPPSRINADISKALNDIILKAMACELEDRYQSVGELIAGLRACA